MQAYSDPSRENDPHALPDIEVFEVNAKEIANGLWDSSTEPGWYWWPCFPGCLPDSEPFGPFESFETALTDAKESYSED